MGGITIKSELIEGNQKESEIYYLQERRKYFDIITDIFDCLQDGLPKDIKKIGNEIYSKESTIRKWINYILAIQRKPKITNFGYVYSIKNNNNCKISFKGQNFSILKKIYRCLETKEKYNISKIHKQSKLHRNTIKLHLNLIKYINDKPKLFQNGNLICITPIINWIQLLLNPFKYRRNKNF